MRSLFSRGYVRVLFALLCVALLVVCVLALEAAMRARYTEPFAAAHAPLSPQNANSIQSWMTFSYINLVFKLPPSYLEQALSIADPRYPALSVAHLAREEHASTTAALVRVRTAVGAYAP